VPVGVSSALFGIVNLDQEIAADAFEKQRGIRRRRDACLHLLTSCCVAAAPMSTFADEC
jgi:hypothetical protein